MLWLSRTLLCICLPFKWAIFISKCLDNLILQLAHILKLRFKIEGGKPFIKKGQAIKNDRFDLETHSYKMCGVFVNKTKSDLFNKNALFCITDICQSLTQAPSTGWKLVAQNKFMTKYWFASITQQWVATCQLSTPPHSYIVVVSVNILSFLKLDWMEL